MARLELFTISVIGLILAVSLQQAFALRCWDCNSNTDDKCTMPGEKLPEDLVKDCDTTFESPVCVKISSTLLGYTRRACVRSTDSADITCKTTKSHDKDAFCGQCLADKCNGASAQYGSAVAVLIVIPIAVMKIFSL